MPSRVRICLLLTYLLHCCNGDENRGASVDRYLEIIRNGISGAENYKLPVDASAYKTNSTKAKDYGTFDYIIIGSGSAGSVIASRLSEVRRSRILLLEAGDEEDALCEIPGMAMYLQGSRYNWGYKMVPQKNACLGMVDHSCSVPRGKGLGGSSLINAMMYVRGSKVDYDQWAEAGNPGWSYKHVLPLFKKSEHSTINGDPGYHGTKGPWNIAHHTPNNLTEILAFLEANQELGAPLVDYNGKQQLGASVSQISSINGQRDSLARAFLLPVRNRKNLFISPNSYVVKILISNRNKQAEGVLFTKEGKLYKAKARKEVILSAGTINSPHLLMLSGVGPANHLQKLGIPVVKDLAVGENLQEHATFHGLTFEMNQTKPQVSIEDMVRQYLDGVGWLSVAFGTEAIGFYQVPKKPIFGPSRPDIELVNSITNGGRPSYLQKSFRYTNETFNVVYGNVDGQRSFSILVVLLHPKARGSIKLKSSNPFDYPLIDPKLLDDPEGVDLDLMAQGVQLAINLTKTQAFQKLNVTLVKSILPQCKDHEYLSKDYWNCTIKHLTSTLYHPIGTCKMGPDPNQGAVVDHKMRVYGVKKLRVADASIIPFATSGHTSAPAAMIGEYLACLIKREKCWGTSLLDDEVNIAKFFAE